MARRRIFIACGEETEEEKRLGEEIKNLIDSHAGMEGFLAIKVHSGMELRKTIFDALRDCSGFVAVMHKRGTVSYSKYDPIDRSSVWIQQEIAIFMYRVFLQDRDLPIRVFIEKGILKEGVMHYSISNPDWFENREEVLAGVRGWLEGPEFDKDPVLSLRESLFQKRIRDLTDMDWLMLKVISAHSVRPDEQVMRTLVDTDFTDMLKDQGIDEGRAISKIINDARRDLGGGAANLIREGLTRDKSTPLVRINAVWWDLLQAELKIRG